MLHGEPRTGRASAAKTLSAVAGLPRPVPVVPTPANIWAAIATSRYEVTRVTIEIIAARPGVLALPRVSSFMVRQVSQPQYMKIDSDRPAVKALNEPTSSGFSQLGEKPTECGRSPDAALPMAIPANSSRTASWRPTRLYWNHLVAVMPR